MKNGILFIGMMLSAGMAFAQPNNVTSASNYLRYYLQDRANGQEDLTKAKQVIDEAATHEKTANEPKMYYYRGKIYQQLHLSENEAIEAISKDALKVSIESFNNALKTADRRTNVEEIKGMQGMNADLAFKEGIANYQAKTFANAIEYFRLRENIMSSIFERIDTVSIFNVGLSAEQAGQIDLAMEQYRECAKLGYNGASMWASMANIEMKRENYDEALAILTEARKKYPEEVSLLTLEINIYLKQGKTDEALTMLDKAIAAEPENASYYFARGTLNEKKEKLENAITDYKKAIELDDKNFDAYYNLGAMYVNQSVPLVEEINNLPPTDTKNYERLKKELEASYANAIPYLERAHELNQEDQATMQTLMELYVKVGENDKYMELKKKLTGQ